MEILRERQKHTHTLDPSDIFISGCGGQGGAGGEGGISFHLTFVKVLSAHFQIKYRLSSNFLSFFYGRILVVFCTLFI